jgi:viroplasmin and RNaseH domain-containing protein
MPYYAVANGRTIGIFLNWNDCNHSVKGYKNASYKKFDTKEEAEMFINHDTSNEKNDLTYNNKPITEYINKQNKIGATIGALLFKKDFPEYLCQFIDLCIVDKIS